MIGDAQDQLDQWGRWTRQGGNDTGTGYKSPMQAIVRAMRGGVLGMPAIPDEVPTRIDRHMARLKVGDRQMYEATRLYYVDGRTHHAIARIVGIERRKVGTLITAAEHWIAGLIDQSKTA